MILRQLQRHRSRVPAIPPRVKPITLQWNFEYSEGWDGPPTEWKSFLSFMEFSPTCSIQTLINRKADLIRMAKENRCTELEIKIDDTPGSFHPQIKLTVTRPARISPKLLATFPWKLRKQQLQPKGL